MDDEPKISTSERGRYSNRNLNGQYASIVKRKYSWDDAVTKMQLSRKKREYYKDQKRIDTYVVGTGVVVVVVVLVVVAKYCGGNSLLLVVETRLLEVVVLRWS